MSVIVTYFTYDMPFEKSDTAFEPTLSVPLKSVVPDGLPNDRLPVAVSVAVRSSATAVTVRCRKPFACTVAPAAIAIAPPAPNRLLLSTSVPPFTFVAPV